MAIPVLRGGSFSLTHSRFINDKTELTQMSRGPFETPYDFLLIDQKSITRLIRVKRW